MISLFLNATLQLQSAAATLAAGAAFLAAFAAGQKASCTAILHSYLGIEPYFATTASGVRAAVTALSDAFGAEAAVDAPPMCPAYACEASMLLMFTVSGIAGAIIGGFRLGG